MTTRRLGTHLLIFAAVIAVMTAVAIWLNLGPAVQAQSLVQIEPWDGDPRVVLAPLDRAGAAQYAHHFQSANGQASRPFALSLTNGTESTIAALTLRWTIVTPSGPGIIVHRMQSAALGGFGGVMTRRSIGAASGKLLGLAASGMPTGILPGESVMLTPGSYSDSRGGGGGWYNELFEARSAAIRIDVVVFEDGLVMGPDDYETVDAVLARKAAVDSVVGMIEDAANKGQNPTMMLSALAHPRPEAPQDHESMTIRMLAMELLRAPDMSKQLESWRALRLPDFHR